MLLWLVFYSMELRKKKGILSGHIQSYLYGRGLIPTCRYTRWIPAFQAAGQLPRARPFHPDTLTISITAPQEAATILQFLFWETMWLWVFFPITLKILLSWCTSELQWWYPIAWGRTMILFILQKSRHRKTYLNRRNKASYSCCFCTAPPHLGCHDMNSDSRLSFIKRKGRERKRKS